MTPRHAVRAALIGLLATLNGCATAPADPSTRTPVTQGGPGAREPQNPRTERTATPTVALLLDGEPVTWTTLRPLLAEAGGNAVIEELALEHALRRELRARGLTVGNTEIDAARETWLALLAESGVGVEAETEVRRRRGLGDQRFRRLLWRNAALRALVDPAEIAVSETEIGLARAVRSGERFLTSGVITRDAPSALAIARAAGASDDGALAGLWHEASARELRPFQSVISPLDPAYPESIRRALSSLRPGQPSAAIAVEAGYAVVIVDAVLAPAPSAPNDAELRRDLTIRKTRLAMESLARRLVAQTEISTLDASLR